MSDPGNNEAPGHRFARATLLLAGFALLGVWRVAIAQGYSDYVPFSIWVAALLVFGAAFYRHRHATPPDMVTAAIAVGIAAAMLPRVLGSELDPYVVALDEAIHPLLGRAVLANEPWHIFDGVSEHFTTPYLDLVLQALLPGLHGARLMSAILSTISLAATYALAKRLYDRQTAVFALLVLGCAYWHIAYARSGYPFSQPMAFVPLAFWVLVTGLQEDHDFPLFVGGILLGGATLVYTPGKVAVPVFAAWWLCGALAGRFRWRSCLPVLLGLVVFLSPHLFHQGPASLLARYDNTADSPMSPIGAAMAEGWLSHAALATLATNIETAMRVYFDGEAWMAPHSAAPGPLIDRVTLILALVGLVLCLWRWRRDGSLLTLIWVGAVFVGGQVLTDVPQSAYRAAPLLPALAIAAGTAMTWIAERAGRWHESFRWVVGFVALACIAPPNAVLLDGFLEARLYDPGGGMARVVGAAQPRTKYFIVDTGPNVPDPRFEILSSGNQAEDVENLNDLLGSKLNAGLRPRSRGVVIIIGPPLSTAEQTIRRCYPGAVELGIPGWREGRPPIALWLRPQAIISGDSCKLTVQDERGLRATYYRSDSFDGPTVRTGLEDWPVLWVGEKPPAFGSVEWRGYLNVPVDGLYTLQLIATSTGSSAAIGKDLRLAPGDRKLTHLASRAYPVTLRFRIERGARFALFWVPPGGEAEAIPPALFSPYPRNRSDNRWAQTAHRGADRSAFSTTAQRASLPD